MTTTIGGAMKPFVICGGRVAAICTIPIELSAERITASRSGPSALEPLLNQLRIAEDGPERGPEFVAHVGNWFLCWLAMVPSLSCSNCLLTALPSVSIPEATAAGLAVLAAN